MILGVTTDEINLSTTLAKDGYKVKYYQVFVSSTYNDLIEDRQHVRNALWMDNFIPVGMEMFPAIDNDQFEYIKRMIDIADYYVLIIGGKYGSLSPENGISYTEKEFDYAVSKKIPILAFLHRNPDNLPLIHSEQEELRQNKLKAFKEKAKNGRLVNFWSSSEELSRLVVSSLRKSVSDLPRPGLIRGSENSDNQLIIPTGLAVFLAGTNGLNKTAIAYILKSRCQNENVSVISTNTIRQALRTKKELYYENGKVDEYNLLLESARSLKQEQFVLQCQYLTQPIIQTVNYYTRYNGVIIEGINILPSKIEEIGITGKALFINLIAKTQDDLSGFIQNKHYDDADTQKFMKSIDDIAKIQSILDADFKVSRNNRISIDCDYRDDPIEVSNVIIEKIKHFAKKKRMVY